MSSIPELQLGDLCSYIFYFMCFLYKTSPAEEQCNAITHNVHELIYLVNLLFLPHLRCRADFKCVCNVIFYEIFLRRYGSVSFESIIVDSVNASNSFETEYAVSRLGFSGQADRRHSPGALLGQI